MDSSMRLAMIPPELMQMITEKAGGSSTINLWASGNRALRFLLAHRCGVRTVDLWDGTQYSTSRWPMMLSELRGLEVLKIDRDSHPLYCPGLVFQELKKMPGLKILHLNCRDCVEILVTERKNAKMESLSELLPNLKELQLTSFSADISLLDLPNSLDRLEAKCVVTDTHCLEQFGNLKTLSLKKDESSPLEIHCPSLTSLALSEFSQLENGSCFPRYLTHFSAYVADESKMESGFIFPISLVNLELNGIISLDSVTFRHLTCLKSLRLIQRGDSNRFHDSTFPIIFPPSLESLSMRWPMKRMPLILPLRLCALNVQRSGSRTLEMRTILEGAKEPSIPLSVGEWEDFKLQMGHVPYESYTRSGLPATLSRLTVSQSDFDFSIVTEPAWPNCLQANQITGLDLSNTVIDDGKAAKFPNFSNLKTLALVLDCREIPPFITQAIYLQSAALTFVHAHYLAPAKTWKDPFEGWPKKSTSCLHFSGLQTLSHSDLVKLSQFEKLASLYGIFTLGEDIKDEDLALLPRSLTSLQLNNSISLTGSCLSFLPPKLFTLCISIPNLKDDDMRLLPRSMRAVQFPSNSLTLQCIPFLPPRAKVTLLLDEHLWRLEASVKLLQQIPDPRISAGSPCPFYSRSTLSETQPRRVQASTPSTPSEAPSNRCSIS
jgi:hypothetical protein